MSLADTRPGAGGKPPGGWKVGGGGGYRGDEWAAPKVQLSRCGQARLLSRGGCPDRWHVLVG
jgi:hypothetical protein